MKLNYLETWFESDFQKDKLLSEYLEQISNKKIKILSKKPNITNQEMYKKIKNYTYTLLKLEKYKYLLQ